MRSRFGAQVSMFHCRWFLAGLMLCLLTHRSEAQLSGPISIDVRGVDREFLVYTPSTYDGSEAVPLLFMFHGLTGNQWDAASSYYGWAATAEANNFIAIFPDSLDGFPLVWPNNPQSDKYWDINFNSPDSQDLDFVSSLLTFADENYNIRDSHVFATGHSYGGFFSYYAARWLDDDIAAFGAHSSGINNGWPTLVPEDSPQLDAILIHSTGDQVVPYLWTQDLYQQLVLGDHNVELISLENGWNHHWNASLNQTQWDFFMNAVAVPEPSSLVVLSFGSIGLLCVRRRHRRPRVSQ